jgi:DNA repair protein RadA/Sms
VEERDAPTAAPGPGEGPTPLADVEPGVGGARATGVPELDRVLGGGLVRGSATLLGGEPGVGKSTLVLQALSSMADRGARCLLASAEESMHQVRLRADRLGTPGEGLWLLSGTSVPGIRAAVEEVEPHVLVVDSIQTVSDPETGSTPGSVAQVRECARHFVRMAKDRAMATVLIGHVTKDGSLAGPRALEHLVDTVLSFEGERHHSLRLLRAQKHRFGRAGELGLFEMGDAGLDGVPDPSCLLLGDRRSGGPGSVVFPAIEGHRPMLVELQALVIPSALSLPPRATQGLESRRLAMVLAVLERRAGLSLANREVYASAVGGVRAGEPGADLPLCLALASTFVGVPLDPELVAFGEVGLGGEIRHVGHVQRRLEEAARLGFGSAMVPASVPDCPAPVRLLRVSTVCDAIEAVGVGSRGVK